MWSAVDIKISITKGLSKKIWPFQGQCDEERIIDVWAQLHECDEQKEENSWVDEKRSDRNWNLLLFAVDVPVRETQDGFTVDRMKSYSETWAVLQCRTVTLTLTEQMARTALQLAWTVLSKHFIFSTSALTFIWLCSLCDLLHSLNSSWSSERF